MPMDSLRERIAEFIGFSVIPNAPDAQVLDRHDGDGYQRTLLRYKTSDVDQVEAFLFEPSVNASATCAVVVLHQHNSQWAFGKREVAGLVGDPLQAFGPALARCGVMVLAPDAVGFESRFNGSHKDGSLAPVLTKPGSTVDGWTQYYNQMAHRLVYGDLLIR